MSYHYTECGLNNIWLRNGFVIKDTPYGEGVAIEAGDELDAAIALNLVCNKPILSGSEFRFLRVALDLSQANLGALVGKDAQSIARWEKQGRVPKVGDRLLRTLYMETVNNNVKVKELLERLNELDQPEFEKIFFEHGKKWRAA